MAVYKVDVRITGDGINAGASSLAVASGVTNVVISAPAAGLRLIGYSARGTGTGGTTSKAVLRHGGSVGGSPLAFIHREDDQEDGAWFGPEGIAAALGIYLERGSGDMELVVYYKAIS